MVKPEQLRKLAEYMGYEVVNSVTVSIDGSQSAEWIPWSYKTDNPYNPLENAEQLLKLMEKIKISIAWNQGLKLWDTYYDITGEYLADGKTIQEAVTLAAVKFVERLEG